MPSQSATQILDIAERRIRLAGYNAVSFRDIAAEMDIKSASLHYHFPKKADLGTALVKRYADNFQARLKEKTQGLSEPADKISAFVDIFREALRDQNLNCLCAVLGAESPGLPDPVSQEVRHFFGANIVWLIEQYTLTDTPSPDVRAKAALAALEGAMVVSTVNDDISVFEAVATMITTT